jgi:chromosomal replication initiator protein
LSARASRTIRSSSTDQTGHGKTHLIQAIGNYFKKSARQQKGALRHLRALRDRLHQFRARGTRAIISKISTAQYDVLIMDDVQFIANTEKTQEELFHLFNALRDNNKQIVFSSDKHPAMLPGFEDRLKGRFAAA